MQQFALMILIVVPALGFGQAADKVVIAHRGASGYLPEHTLAAKAMAHAMGADLLDIFFHKAEVDGVFTDFPDRAVRFLERSQ